MATAPLSFGQTNDWPQFLGPTRNGEYAGVPLAGQWPKEGPPQIWQRAVGAGFSSPVVSAGKLILFHRQNDKEVLECLDAARGQKLWQAGYDTAYQDDFGFDEGPRATPTIAGDRVYTLGAEGLLACWELAGGGKLWQVDTRNRFRAGKGFFGIACSPLVESNAVIVNVGGKEGAGIVAFDSATGRVLWQATDDEASYASPVGATIKGQRYAFVLTREALVAANPADGRIFFRFPWRPPMQLSVSAASPLIVGDQIFLSACYGAGAEVLRFRENGPEKIWSAEDALSNHYATSVHHDGFIFGWDGRQEQGCDLRCVDLKTGKVRWSESGLGAGTVTLAHDQLLVLTEKGMLLRVPASPSGFKATGRAQILPFGVRAYPALAGGLLYSRSKDKLVCVDLRPGR